MRRDEDVAQITQRVLKARFSSVAQFERKHFHTIIDYDFEPGKLVIVLNKKIEPEMGRKGKPRYFDLLMVAKRLRNGNYCLAEVNGALSRLKYAAYRLIPYYPRCRKALLVTDILDDAELADIAEDGE